MLQVNLLKNILIRFAVSTSIFLSTYFITRNLGDSFQYLYGDPYTSEDLRTGITRFIFSQFFLIFSKFGSLIVVCLLGNFLLYFSIKKYLKKDNIFLWNLLLFLPCLLIYSTTPSKEFLFFISSTIYIILECEYLFSINLSKKNKFWISTSRYTILIFMVIIRGPLSIPYIILALILNLIKKVDLNLINLKNVNLIKLFLFSSVLSLAFNYFLNFYFPEYYTEQILRFNGSFAGGSVLSRIVSEETLNFINPINLFRIGFLSFFPTFDQFYVKPYVLIIIYESLVMIFLFIKMWGNLFNSIKKDNYAKLIFSLIFITIIFCYLSLYGVIGYFNLGSAQRFRVNLIPITFFLPLISNELINKKKKILSEKIKISD